MSALRVRPVPVVEPRPALSLVPDDTDADAVPGRPVQEALPIDPPVTAVAAGPARGTPDRDRDLAAADLCGADAPPAAGPLVGGAGAGASGARGWAVRFAQVALEVLAGLRPPAQLVRWTSDEAQAALQSRHPVAARPGARPRQCRIRSLHVSVPVEGVAEVAVVVADGLRYRAMAFRMEGRDRHWLVTAIDLG